MKEKSGNINSLGGLIVSSLRNALNEKAAPKRISKEALLALAGVQGIHGYAAVAIREIQRREDLGETAWASVSNRELYVFGEVSSIKRDVFWVVDSFSSPGTLITDSLSSDDIVFLEGYAHRKETK